MRSSLQVTGIVDGTDQHGNPMKYLQLKDGGYCAMTLAAGDWSVDSEGDGEESNGDCFRACRVPTTTTNNVEWFEGEHATARTQVNCTL